MSILVQHQFHDRLDAFRKIYRILVIPLTLNKTFENAKTSR